MPEEKKKISYELIAVAIACAILVALFSHLPLERDISGTLVAAVFILLPLICFNVFKLSRKEIGLEFSCWKRDLKIFFIFSAIIFPLYSFIYIPFQGYIMLRNVSDGNFFELLPRIPEATKHILGAWRWQVMDKWYLFIISEFIAIAVPEELFFRGYFQGRLERIFTKRIKFLGAEIGMAIIVSALLFALMHIISVPSAQRLGVFIPALIFGFMRSYSGSILSAVLFHTASNIYTSFMDYCVFGG